jgi:hypothetical protein
MGSARRTLAATLLLLLCGSASAQQEDLAIEHQGVARHVLLHRPTEAALLVKLGYNAKAEKRLAGLVYNFHAPFRTSFDWIV